MAGWFSVTPHLHTFYFLPRNARLHSTPQIQGGPRSSPRHLGGGRGVCHKPTRREACPANRNAPRKVGDEKLEQTATECTPAESIRYADTLVNRSGYIHLVRPAQS